VTWTAAHAGVAVAKHKPPVVLAVKQHERLKALDAPGAASNDKAQGKKTSK
jgi:hypothetical protein